MAVERYVTKVVYYGGYPGSSGKPVAGRLRWADGVLTFEPRGGDGPALRIERDRLMAVRRDEEGMTGARRVRLLVDVATERGGRATLKFEMAGVWRKGARLHRWIDLLGRACRAGRGNHV